MKWKSLVLALKFSSQNQPTKQTNQKTKQMGEIDEARLAKY